MTEVERCLYGTAEWDPRGFFIARCPKHPEHFSVDLRVPPVGHFHLVVKSEDEGEDHPPCCTSCGGSGGDRNGPCWDCRGTGHPHP